MTNSAGSCCGDEFDKDIKDILFEISAWHKDPGYSSCKRVVVGVVARVVVGALVAIPNVNGALVG